MESETAVTELLAAWNAGDPRVTERLMEVVYDQLRSIARREFRRERRDHTLQPTALVHEAYARLVEQSGLRFENRAHFLGLASRVMRRVLVDHARERATAKRGGKAARVTLAEAASAAAPDVELMALNEALGELEQLDPRKVEVIELRFFGGLSIDDTAEVLGISRKTVVREWRRARAWLHHRLAV